MRVSLTELGFPEGTKIVYTKGDTKAIEGSTKTATVAPKIITRNYGIDLHCGKYIVLDVDNPENLDCRLPVTWSQKTKRGMHHVYLAPPGFEPHKANWYNLNGEKIGEILGIGHIMGPGSTIKDHTYEPIPAPIAQAEPWMIQKLVSRTTTTKDNEGGYDKLPMGSQDDLLTSIAGDLYNSGLSMKGVAHGLYGLSAVLEQREDDPYTLESFMKKVKTWEGKWERRPTVLGVNAVRTLADFDTKCPKAAWWIHNFIPQGELTLMFGGSGVGKSSFLSYVSSLVLRKNKTFGISISEEPVEKFAVRTALSMEEGEINQYENNFYDIRRGWKFPRDIDALDTLLTEIPLDFLYFDSIKSNLMPGAGGVDPNNAIRECLEPLMDLARKHDVTIFGTFHTTKTGGFHGPQEIINVPRMVLEAERKDELIVKVYKTSFTEPDYVLSFDTEVKIAKSLQGEDWVDVDENDVEVPVKMYAILTHKKADEEADKAREARNAKIIELHEKKLTLRGIENELDSTEYKCGYSTIQSVVKQYKKDQAKNTKGYFNPNGGN